jgi:hypothetical protein
MNENRISRHEANPPEIQRGNNNKHKPPTTLSNTHLCTGFPGRIVDGRPLCVVVVINSACSIFLSAVSSPLNGKFIKVSWYGICGFQLGGKEGKLSKGPLTSPSLANRFMRLQAWARVQGRSLASSASSPKALFRSSPTPRAMMSSTAPAMLEPLRTL